MNWRKAILAAVEEFGRQLYGDAAPGENSHGAPAQKPRPSVVTVPCSEGDTYHITAACISDVGKRRRRNEDNFVLSDRCLPLQHGSMDAPQVMSRSLRRGERMAVFDGMGGGANGEDASYTAAALLAGEPFGHLASEEQVETYLVRLCRRMNQCVNTRQLEMMCGQMGSTAAMVYFWDGAAYVCNVGDSPVFLLRRGVLEKLSQDHTDRALLESQHITGRKPGLTQFLGMDPEEYAITPSITRCEIERGDTFLVCSDGVTDMLSRRMIEEVLCAAGQPERQVMSLRDNALARGGVDNITAAVCTIR